MNITNGFQPDTNAYEKKSPVLPGLAWHRAAQPKVLLLSREQCPCRVTCSKLALGRNGPYPFWDLAISPWNNTVLKLAFLIAQAESKLVCFVCLSWYLKKVWMECFKIGHTHLGLPQALHFLLCNIWLASPMHIYVTHLLPQASDLWSRSNGSPCSVFS